MKNKIKNIVPIHEILSIEEQQKILKLIQNNDYKENKLFLDTKQSISESTIKELSKLVGR